MDSFSMFTEAEGSVKTHKYSWGTMKTVHHGASFSIPLHPEHHQAIHNLKDGESHHFTDETKSKWKATREGNKVHFSGEGRGNSGYKTSVSHEHMKEDVNVTEEKDTIVRDAQGKLKSWSHEGDWSKSNSSGTTTDKSGAKHTSYSKVRDLARNALKKTLKKEEVQIDEGKMGQLSADIGSHIDKHVADYKSHGGAEHLMSKIDHTAKKIASQHGLEHKHAHKFVSDYVEKKLHEEELAEKDYSVTINHYVRDGEKRTQTDHEYVVKNANNHKHAKNIAMQRHGKKVGPLKPGQSYGTSSNNVKELHNEDVATSEYKVKKFIGPDGLTHERKVRPHMVRFKNSKANAQPVDDQEIDDKEVKESAPVAPAPHIHRIGVTVSDPGHTSVTQRKEKQEKFVRVTHHTDNKDEAIERGKKHFAKKGWKVHDAWHTGMVHEEVEQVDELSNQLLQRYKDKAMKSADDLAAKGKHSKANDRYMKHMQASGKQISTTMKKIHDRMNNR